MSPAGDIAEHFSQRYERAQSASEAAVEMEVFGISDQGINGYTTVEQADDLADRLALRAGMRLLDIGAGRGWTGLYLARTTRCQVVLADLPLPALRQGMDRAAKHDVEDRSAFVLASGTHIPFRPGAFDAIIHTDVL